MKKYFIKRPKLTIEPEEILLDPVAAKNPNPYERMEFPVSSFWGKFFISSLLAALVFLGGLVVYYQISRGDEFLVRAEENRLRFLFEDAPRGIIEDRVGKVVAENHMVFDVLVFSLDLPKEIQALQKEGEAVAENLGLEGGAVVEVLKRIQAKNLAEPAVLVSNIRREGAISLKSREIDLPGIRVQGRYQRYYQQGSALAHVIGYTGRVSAKEIEVNPNFRPRDLVGRQGLEAKWDELLRGVRGETRYEVDAALKNLQEKERIAPEPGKKLKLAIDSELQDYFYQIMLSQMRRVGLDRGAGVALDPRTGEVLALVSLPSFDNNLFAQGISQEAFSRLSQSKSKPLFNRAVAGEYSPGSTIKPFMAAAGLQEGVIKPETEIIDDEGKIVVPNPYDPEKPTIFRDWKIHGPMNVKEALADSCNVYFYTVGGGHKNIKGLGISRIKKYLLDFGFGSELGLDLLGERQGLVPDPEWKENNRIRDPIWRIGDTYLTSIGQGDLELTPLQLAAATAAIANGGKLWAPYLVKAIFNEDGLYQEFLPKLIREIPIDSRWLEVVKEGMRLAVTRGTASALADMPIKVAGKTGTAQVLSNTQTNAFFTSFAPLEDPQIVLVVVVENGQGGITNAVPVAKEVLSWWWANRYLATGH